MSVEATCPACQAKFQVKDEFAGRKVRCSECKAVIELPALQQTPTAFRVDSALDPAFQRDKFLLHQKLVSINTRYAVFDESGVQIMHVSRPTYLFRQLLALFAVVFAILIAIVAVIFGFLFLHPIIGDIAAGIYAAVAAAIVIFVGIFVWAMLVPKRHIDFYRDEQMQHLLLEVLQENKFAIYLATYTVRDENGREIGRFRKDYLAGLLRKRWDGFDAQGKQFLVAREDSMILSLLRRVLGSFYGLLRTNFVIYQSSPGGKEGSLLGEFNRKFTLLDRYVLDCSPDRTRSLDRRMAIALGVLLDTAEGR